MVLALEELVQWERQKGQKGWRQTKNDFSTKVQGCPEARKVIEFCKEKIAFWLKFGKKDC
jgi:hypothetical protein